MSSGSMTSPSAPSPSAHSTGDLDRVGRGSGRSTQPSASGWVFVDEPGEPPAQPDAVDDRGEQRIVAVDRRQGLLECLAR